ncbi:hypothetical protein AVEN_80490-1 [Araneus ventricosus]|uniref:Peptidase M12A domain-containing protein n=1 Tax=Araneus ventricosus TaxID=182803 RepID=A0A4Y2V991_ARAVE|nr:hypothetical protein AVEN_80490-1 [Araneus ventricosus]
MEFLEHGKENAIVKVEKPMKCGTNDSNRWNSNELKIQHFMHRFQFGASNEGSDRLDQFKRTEAKVEYKTTDFDCESILHYRKYAFSIDPNVLETMESKTGCEL